MDQVALYKALADAAELGHTTTVKTLLVKDLHSMWRLVLAFLVFTIPRLAELGDSGIGPGKLFVRAELASAAAPPPAAAPAALAGAGPRPRPMLPTLHHSSRNVSRNLLSEHYDRASGLESACKTLRRIGKNGSHGKDLGQWLRTASMGLPAAFESNQK